MNQLPAAKNDPVLDAAHEATASYQRELESIRADTSLSPLGRSERIDALWASWQARIEQLRDQFYEPRRERALELEKIVPIGPGIPEDASPADSAVLHQAFNAAYARAQGAGLEELGDMYAQASRFGDETTLRAVLTVASDKGLNRIIDAWAAGDPARQSGLRELGKIRDLFSGSGTDAGFARLAFNGMGIIRQPQESLDLGLHRERAGVR